MKTAFAVAVLLVACLLSSCYAQSTSRFQGVGGDFGKSVIGSFKANSTQQNAESNANDLWNWGSAPKGSLIKNGKLVTDPFYIWQSLNYTDGWIGDIGVDPYTGNPIYAYEDPYTGEIKYFYVDPYTGRPVYIDRGQTSDVPQYGSVSPFYASNDWWGSYALPPVFNSNDPWS